jgi:RNA polymerase sigma factor FliA
MSRPGGGNSASRVAAEARALWARFIASGDQTLRQQLVESYLPFAAKVAGGLYRRRIDSSVPFEDYLQYARLGLMEAVDRYDPSQAASFETFCGYRIRGAILNGISQESERAAQHQRWRAQTLERVQSLRAAPEAGADDLDQLVQMTVGLALGLLLDAKAEPADDSAAANPYAATELAQLRTIVRECVTRLPDREREILGRHYFAQQQFQRIAHDLGVTKGRIAQLHAQALAQLRGMLVGRARLDQSL